MTWRFMGLGNHMYTFVVEDLGFRAPGLEFRV